MARAFLFVLDSFGIGGAADAPQFGDEGSDTFGHIVAECRSGRADRDGLREGPLQTPNMDRLGLRHAAAIAHGSSLPDEDVTGFFGAAQEVSGGKDTPSGHWEIAGVPVTAPFRHFPDTVPAIPGDFIARIVEAGEIAGFVGNCRASGTDIVEKLGAEHVATGKPIIYTSTDSVIQVAAHEHHFGLERLYALCRTIRRLADGLNVGRVIARPFIGDAQTGFTRTANRKDYSVPPPEPTLLDRIVEHGGRVLAVGKIGDIFAHRGISDVRKAPDNMAMFDQALGAMEDAADGDLVFANFVDFDTQYGHRRDVAGYAAALEAFDSRLPEAILRLRDGDMLILTADHGCDPTWHGTDHTRERVPVLGTGPGLKSVALGLRSTFADIGETVAAHLGLAPGPHGRSFRDLIAHA